MKVRIESLIEGARSAVGHVVVIDVFRAFTTAAVAFSRGTAKIFMVDTVEDALALRECGIAQLCMGEVRGRMPVGFDLGNSPFQAGQVAVAGKVIAQRTSAGTQGIVSADKATRWFAGSLVTAAATARAIRADSPPEVTLVAMGNEGTVRTVEDELCAIYLRDLLEGRQGNAAAVRDVILAGPRTSDFANPAKAHLHPDDLTIALDINRFDFAVEIDRHEGQSVARLHRPT